LPAVVVVGLISLWWRGCYYKMENIWHLRKVAETSAKGCFICYKPTSSVMITPDNKDYFYICPAHLKDKNFAVPTDDEAKAMEERKKKEDLDKEIELIKKEYEEKLKRKKEKSKKKDDNKDADKDKSEKKDESQSEAHLEKEKEEKVWQGTSLERTAADRV